MENNVGIEINYNLTFSDFKRFLNHRIKKRSSVTVISISFIKENILYNLYIFAFATS